MEQQISDETILNLKRNLQKEIDRIDRKITYITKLKDEALETLIKQKQECHDTEIIGEIDEEVKHLKYRHDVVLKKQEQIHKAREEYMKLEETVANINNELMSIQERHDNVMQQLNEKREFLQARLGSIETLDNMKVKLDEETETETEAYANELERLKREREELLQRTDLSPSEMELALREIDERIEQLEGEHIRKMAELEHATSELQAEFSKNFTTKKKDEILQELEKLKLQAMTATPSELVLIQARIDELNKELDQLQTLEDAMSSGAQDAEHLLEERGLKLTSSGRIITRSGHVLTTEEAMAQGLLDGFDQEELIAIQELEKLHYLLEERGLKLTPSGRIQLETGEVITMEEARQLGLLKGLENQLMKLRGLTLTPSGRILTKDGRLLSKSEAERLGLLDGIDLDEMFAVPESESVTVSGTTETSMSGMSSADVHYLKAVLGKPLALALAEITAKQPRDPIHYLGHWLYKFRYNQEFDDARKKELEELLEERARLESEAIRKQAEADARSVLLELIGKIGDEAEKHATAEKLKLLDEQAALMDEEAELESEARDTLGVYDGPTRGQHLF